MGEGQVTPAGLSAHVSTVTRKVFAEPVGSTSTTRAALIVVRNAFAFTPLTGALKVTRNTTSLVPVGFVACGSRTIEMTVGGGGNGQKPPSRRWLLSSTGPATVCPMLPPTV